jgi:hypothetical protein
VRESCACLDGLGVASAERTHSVHQVPSRGAPGLTKRTKRVQQGLIVRIEPVAQQMEDSDRGAGIHLKPHDGTYSAPLQHCSELVLSRHGVVVGEGRPFCPDRGDRVGDICGRMVSIAQ